MPPCFAASSRRRDNRDVRLTFALEHAMKQFMIRYRRANADAETWHRDIATFISAIDSDPELRGRIGYRVMRLGGGDDYLHIATPTDDQAVKTLQSRDFFKRYNERTRAVAADGKVDVTGLELIGETKGRA